MKRHRNNATLIETIVARKTKGLAFSHISSNEYRAHLSQLHETISRDIESLSRSEIKTKYADQLWDEA